ncbi:MAG: hypothetical protein V3S93_04375, partial [Methyloceanibacter sp.]
PFKIGILVYLRNFNRMSSFWQKSDPGGGLHGFADKEDSLPCNYRFSGIKSCQYFQYNIEGY